MHDETKEPNSKRQENPAWPAVCLNARALGVRSASVPDAEVSVWPRCSNPDPCVGYLPGVYNACCGHGEDDEAYITFGGAKGGPAAYGAHAKTIMTAMRHALGDINDESWHGGHD
jgi:hypothetical protein